MRRLLPKQYLTGLAVFFYRPATVGANKPHPPFLSRWQNPNGTGLWRLGIRSYEPSATVVVQRPWPKQVGGKLYPRHLYFDDYSAVLHAGASWSWSFSPAPQSVSGANTRTPKVVFGSSGAKQAIMTLATPLGTFKDTLNITVANGCDMDSIPGNALQLNGSTDYVAITQPLNLNSNTVTISAWIKPDGPQNDWAALVFCRGGTTTAGISLKSDNELRYHWDGNKWSWSSGLYVPDNEWTHVAMVITPSAGKVYVNGIAATNTSSHAAEAFDATTMFGYDTNSSQRRFKGKIDEVCIYNESLTQDQIREVMHLTRTHTQPNNTGLVAYYQMNENDGPILDRIGTKHGALVGSSARVPSTVPVGPGASARLNVTSGGAYSFPNTGLTLSFPNSATYPNGELCATRIQLDPDVLPSGGGSLSPAYWVVRNFGTNASFTTLSGLTFDNIGTVPNGSAPAEYSLFKRSSNADGNTWGNAIDQADVLGFGTAGSVGFTTGNSVNSFSQFVLRGPDGALPVEMSDFVAEWLPEQGVQLRWVTQVEQNTSHFLVERSADGLHFAALAQVPAQGFSTVKHEYRLMHQQPMAGLNYYRIRSVDHDGSNMLSVIRAVNVTRAIATLQVFPNPASVSDFITVQTDSQEPVLFRIFNEKGQALRTVRFTQSAQISCEGLPEGVYLYRAESSYWMRFGKVVVGN
ncbi:MAG: T9SS type A sorting domain-containing protein [Lewinellaceae bacterium]|nr:T9SS type A sorting domain-containing protein [Lewinellaceae bacterium]